MKCSHQVRAATVRLTLRGSEAAGVTEPDWTAVHRELPPKHVTLSILWEEYVAAGPSGYRYSRFCDLYREWEGRLPETMRQTLAAGERLFVDNAGDGVPVVIDRLSAEIR
jgi:transposase